jgi:hypothetical protein
MSKLKKLLDSCDVLIYSGSEPGYTDEIDVSVQVSSEKMNRMSNQGILVNMMFWDGRGAGGKVGFIESKEELDELDID